MGGREAQGAFGDRARGPHRLAGAQLGCSDHLGAQVWGGAKEKPNFVVGSESQLGLASRAAVKLAVPQPLAIGAGAIPLRQATAGRAAEDMDPNQPEFRSALIPFDSDRACVTGAFKKDRHRFERRFDPPFFRSHESLNSIRSYAIWVKFIF